MMFIAVQKHLLKEQYAEIRDRKQRPAPIPMIPTTEETNAAYAAHSYEPGHEFPEPQSTFITYNHRDESVPSAAYANSNFAKQYRSDNMVTIPQMYTSYDDRPNEDFRHIPESHQPTLDNNFEGMNPYNKAPSYQNYPSQSSSQMVEPSYRTSTNGNEQQSLSSFHDAQSINGHDTPIAANQEEWASGQNSTFDAAELMEGDLPFQHASVPMQNYSANSPPAKLAIDYNMQAIQQTHQILYQLQLALFHLLITLPSTKGLAASIPIFASLPFDWLKLIVEADGPDALVVGTEVEKVNWVRSILEERKLRGWTGEGIIPALLEIGYQNGEKGSSSEARLLNPPKQKIIEEVWMVFDRGATGRVVLSMGSGKMVTKNRKAK